MLTDRSPQSDGPIFHAWSGQKKRERGQLVYRGAMRVFFVFLFISSQTAVSTSVCDGDEVNGEVLGGRDLSPHPSWGDGHGKPAGDSAALWGHG